MVQAWKKPTAILASVYALRMLGMFMIFPVFSLYAETLRGQTPLLVSCALGIYGLTQALLQIPFGRASDRWGRRPMMALGLVLFIIGSVIAANAGSIYAMIVGRAIQGMGAISAVTLAYGTDVVPREKRGLMMAIIGGSIGMAFVLSLILGPLLAGIVGVNGLFWMIALLCVLALGSVWLLPTPEKQTPALAAEGVFNRREIYRASTAIFLTHAIFTATFLVLPPLLVAVGLPKNEHWWLYLPANLVALGFMRYRARPTPLNFGSSFVLMAVALLLMLSAQNSFWLLSFAVVLYFIGFYRLETGLPHWVANVASEDGRGKAMGIFATAQFAGSFVGAMLSGLLWELFSKQAVLAALVVCALGSANYLLRMMKK